MSKLYTAKELSEILKVSPKTIYKLAKNGELESYRIGKSVRFVNPAEREEQNNEQIEESITDGQRGA